jgi:diguanylate cyclase (GGDEF)-like protein
MGFYTKKIAIMRAVSIVLALLLLLTAYGILRYTFRRFARRIDIFQQRLIQKNRTLTKLSSVDHLTKACNRRKIEDLLYSEYTIQKRYGTDLGIILLDVDNFKQINDNYGHDVGDRVLRTLSKLFATSIRESDYFGRWGGEEFLIVAPNTSLNNTFILAEKLRKIVADHPFEGLEAVTCSFGVAQSDPEEPVKTAIKNADDALYRAKEEGKNRVYRWENFA